MFGRALMRRKACCGLSRHSLARALVPRVTNRAFENRRGIMATSARATVVTPAALSGMLPDAVTTGASDQLAEP
jgi:hypothetical protein